MTLRTIQGYVQLPAEPVTDEWGDATVELRDVSQMDEPSRVIASVTLPRIRLTPGARFHFQIRAPASEPQHSLNLRAQLQSTEPDARPGASLYLTTVAYPVPTSGDVDGLMADLKKVSG